MISDELQNILNDDDGLLDSPVKQSAQTGDQRLVSSFLEIVNFYEKNHHEPSSLNDDIAERRLANRLTGLRNDQSKVDALKQYDSYDLLRPVKYPDSVDEILDDDDLGIFDEESDIHTIRNLPKDISKPEYVGRQRKCDDFDTFEPLFKQAHEDLQSGKRKIVAFNHQKEIVAGNYFVLKGVLVYVDKVGERTLSVNGLEDARLRLIYENGTESDILLLSFAKALFLDGRLITTHEDHLLDNLKGIDNDDVESGYIYILSSLSQNPKIREIHNLYKIGFSTRTVEERIKHAETDPTYLMAPVKIEATYKCFNMTTQKFEHLLHRVFSKARLNLEITDLDKTKYVPDEWFIVPLEVVDQAISLIISDEIVHYQYDTTSERLTEKRDSY